MGDSMVSYIDYMACEAEGSPSSLTARAVWIGLGKAHDGCRRSTVGQRTTVSRTSSCRCSMDRWAFGQPGNLFAPTGLTSAGWQRRCHKSRPEIHRMSGPLVVRSRHGVYDSAIQHAHLPLDVTVCEARVWSEASASGSGMPVGSVLVPGVGSEATDCQPLGRIR
jgi:hypothetical protein